MITLFVVQSCADAKDPKVSIDSFEGLEGEVHLVETLDEINGTERKHNWYGVIYDDEHIDEQLLEGLKVFIEHTDADALVLYRMKGGDKASRSPRLFRRHITLEEGSLMPEGEVKFETVLNGWVLSNDKS